MTEFDNKGQIALWKDTGGKTGAPVMKGHFYAHRDIRAGEKIEVALWHNASENPNAPSAKGKIQDPWQPEGQSSAPPQDDFEDSELPF